MSSRTKSPGPPAKPESGDATPLLPALPWFWPTAAMNLVGLELDTMRRATEFAAEAFRIDHGLLPVWSTPNAVRLELDTMQLRAFLPQGRAGVPTLVVAPYAGHHATIADYAVNQSLVGVLMANGVTNVFVTDWRSATEEMKDFTIETYAAELNAVIDELGGVVNLVGLCQGGWMSAGLAARFPQKVRALVLAGSPIDTDAGSGPLKAMAHELPLAAYQELVTLGNGRLKGETMLGAWKSMHPDKQYIDKYVELFQHIDDEDYLKRTETFARWYENPLDLPGRFYLQAVEWLFQNNRLAKGEMPFLGRAISLRDVVVPAFLLGGEADDITPAEQVFAAEHLVGTPKSRIEKRLVPGGHIGLFMGSRTLAEHWPHIAKWLIAADHDG